jgi:hypothetical protein
MHHPCIMVLPYGTVSLLYSSTFKYAIAPKKYKCNGLKSFYRFSRKKKGGRFHRLSPVVTGLARRQVEQINLDVRPLYRRGSGLSIRSARRVTILDTPSVQDVPRARLIR